MAFPAVQDRVTSEEGAGTTTHGIDLPATINSGDLLVAFYGHRDDSAGDILPPDGWRVFMADRFDSSSLLVGMFREADGTEGSSITMETLTSVESSHVVYRLTGHESIGTQFPEASTASIPDDWALRATAEDFNVSLSVATQQVETGTLDPASFTSRASDDWTAATIVAPPSGTAFPETAETAFSKEGTSVTSHTVSLPGSISSGDLLIGIFGCSRNNADDVSWPTGWTEIGIVGTGKGGGNRLSVAWRDADGTEGASITVTTTNSGESAHTVLRITGAADPTSSPPEVATANGTSATPDPPSLTYSGGSDTHLWIAAVCPIAEWGANAATGTSTSPDPPSLTPTGGAKDYLWLAACEHRDGSDATGAPTNYTNLQTISDFRTAIATAERELNASSEDPGTFTFAASADWVAATAVIHPASAPSGLSIPIAMHHLRQQG